MVSVLKPPARVISRLSILLTRCLLEECALSVDEVDESTVPPKPEPRRSIVELLLETGRVDANSKDTYGKTPIAYAIGVLSFKRYNGDKAAVPVVELLLRAGAVMP